MSSDDALQALRNFGVTGEKFARGIRRNIETTLSAPDRPERKTAVDELVGWLREQLDEDERVALAASVGPWRAAPADSVYAHPTAVVHMPGPLPHWATLVVPPQEEGGEGIEPTDAEHIARWDPARVLAEVKAKRRILDDYEAYVRERRRAMNGWDPEARNPSPIIKYLAQPYAGRPGWREEWRAV